MEDAPDDEPVPQSLRFLKTLVTVLTMVMIVGMVVLVALFITRLGGGETPVLPENITLPDGSAPEAVTFGSDWIAIVSDDQILIYDRATGKLRQTVEVLR
jgi:hypothetical protein